jgi:hypothetical protein
MLEASDPITFTDAVLDLVDVWRDEDLRHGYRPDDGWPCLLAEPEAETQRLQCESRCPKVVFAALRAAKDNIGMNTFRHDRVPNVC